MIAIIPARGGSKRILRKNVKMLAGKPAIAYAIELALTSGIFEQVLVSTDDTEIAEISKKYGALVPFLRDPELSNDYAITVDVIADVVGRLKCNGKSFEYVCCIYPVTPLLRECRLKEALMVIKSGLWDYVFPAIEFPAPIERGFKKGNLGGIEFSYPEFANSRTQDIDKTFHDAGQFYFGKSTAWLEKKPILNGVSTFVELDKHEVIDIDDLEDWEMVEKLITSMSDDLL
jgi:N-acylneuraminate cytidylyltransferase